MIIYFAHDAEFRPELGRDSASLFCMMRTGICLQGAGGASSEVVHSPAGESGCAARVNKCLMGQGLSFPPCGPLHRMLGLLHSMVAGFQEQCLQRQKGMESASLEVASFQGLDLKTGTVSLCLKIHQSSCHEAQILGGPLDPTS